MIQPLHPESLHAAIAQSRTTLLALSHEADAVSLKGMCGDDFEWYAQRLTELQQHLAYLLHLEALVLAAVPFVPAPDEDDRREEEAAAAENAALADAPCDRCADVRRHAIGLGRTDAYLLYCSEGCWELGTAPAYYNARTDPATVAARVTGEGYADTEPVDEAAVRRELLAQSDAADREAEEEAIRPFDF